jgi:hypothetical protein
LSADVQVAAARIAKHAEGNTSAGARAALGVALIALLARAKQSHPRAIDRAAAAAASTHTIPTQPAPEARPHPPAAPATSVT